MKIENDVQEFAYLMHKTGYTYQQIYQYIKAQDAYFCTLDDEEAVKEKEMFEFIEHFTSLSFKQVINIGKTQLQMEKEQISIEEECEMVKEMVHSFTIEDREYMNIDFYLLSIDYDLFI